MLNSSRRKHFSFFLMVMKVLKILAVGSVNIGNKNPLECVAVSIRYAKK